MGFFKKKEEKKQEPMQKIPNLPELPEFPKLERERFIEPSQSQLPKLPLNSPEESFSKDIKKAISGEKEGERVFNANDFAKDNNMQMMQKTPNKLPPITKTERTREIENEFTGFPVQKEEINFNKPKSQDSIFIRIDKFEESLNSFEKIKRQILELEEFFKEIKNIKEEEERELQNWEKEIQDIKGKIETIDSEIFSRIE